MRPNLLDNPAFIFLFCLFSIVVNLVSSIHFLSIMLCGILFLISIKCFENKYYYSLTILVLSFLIIEFNIGLYPFTLLILAAFSYLFVLNHLKSIISSNDLIIVMLITWFYILILLFLTLFNNYEVKYLLIIVINIIIDVFLAGVLL